MAKRPQRQDIMLAQHADEGRVRRLSHYGLVISQPKYNGERCWVEWFHGEPVLISSYGNQFHYLGHIIAELLKLNPNERLNFDGELYHHGWSRQKIHGLVSKTRNHPGPDVAGIQFHIFDHKSNNIQSVRLQEISTLFIQEDRWAYSWAIQEVPNSYVKVSEWRTLAGLYIEDGYEGAILRSPIGRYIPSKGVHMLKFKPTEKDTYTIIGVTEAISQKGERKGMVGAFMVKDSDDRVFKVGAGKLTHAQRVDYWERRNELLERTLLVKHELIPTDGGIPVSAVAVEVK